jgi:hypothetical protein
MNPDDSVSITSANPDLSASKRPPPKKEKKKESETAGFFLWRIHKAKMTHEK